jgi:uncharacterized membrane protein YedE/YeeE
MIIISFLAGLIFGIGLIISGMADPAKVLSFLDVAGLWNPSLIVVMAGAIGVGFFAFLWAKSRKTTLLGGEMKLPSATKIDRRLIIGAVMFGIGWGIAGFCPGPALVGLGMGLPKALIFVAAMLAGMALYECSTDRAVDNFCCGKITQ